MSRTCAEATVVINDALETSRTAHNLKALAVPNAAGMDRIRIARRDVMQTSAMVQLYWTPLLDVLPALILKVKKVLSSRRRFLSFGTTAATVFGLGQVPLMGLPGSSLFAAESDSDPWLKKTLKLYMVKPGSTLKEKFQIAKEAGFEGIELDAPGFNVEEAKAAVQETGLPIDGTVNGTHWAIRHSDPDAAVRAKALESCINGLKATAAVGGDTMLLVAGHGKDGSPEEVFDRAVANIKLAIPVAEELGVKIAIENVWNHFLYDHEGGRDQSAEPLAKFIDAFDSKWVGVQYDIGNHWKYGNPAEWIRTLGKRVIKLDVKGYSRANENWSSMADSDIPWADVRAALQQVGFNGWLAAEMSAGDLDYLKQTSDDMDRLLVKGSQ